MIVNILSNLGPLASVGLERDYLILQRQLTDKGHAVRAIDLFSPPAPPCNAQADINIWLESLQDPRYLRGYAKANWLIPNDEYWFTQWNQYLPSFSLIGCKTRSAHDHWRQKVGESRCLYTSFESRDMYQPGILKQKSFLHVCGKSLDKATNVVINAWKRFSIPHALTVVTCARTDAELAAIKHLGVACWGNPHIKHLHNLSDELLTIEMNRNRFFILPSLAEGYGHALHEAMSAKAVILTTDAPPMNAFPGTPDRETGLLIPVTRTTPRMDVQFNYVNEEGVAAAVEHAVRMDEAAWDKLGAWARRGWQQEQDRFRETFKGMIENWWSYV